VILYMYFPMSRPASSLQLTDGTVEGCSQSRSDFVHVFSHEPTGFFIASTLNHVVLTVESIVINSARKSLQLRGCKVFTMEILHNSIAEFTIEN